MTAAVLAATRRLSTLRPWRFERARFVLGAVAAAIGGAQLVAGLAQRVAANEAVAAALPWALAGAAGAMLFVVLHEMVPQLRQAGARPVLGGLAGIAAMVALDAAVG